MIRVNDVEIGEAAVAREVQYHPAPSLAEARRAAERALVVRELLLQEAHRLAVSPDDGDNDDGDNDEDDGEEGPDDALIRTLLETTVVVAEADESQCRAEFERRPDHYRGPDLFEAAHILFAASPDNGPLRDKAREAAAQTLALLQAAPGRFAELARERSACPSAAEGGSLGQFTGDQMVPEFMTVLDVIDPGTLCPAPVPTPFGYHVIRLDHRERGRALPFERVRERVALDLFDRAWRLAVHAYIGEVAGRARIEGFSLDLAS